MPPQDENQAVVQAGTRTGESYWDEPPEEKLQGKTLSTLNLSDVEQSHEAPQEHGPKRVNSGYWDEVQENIKKTLSKLSLSDLVGTNRGEQDNTETTADSDDSMPKRPSTNSFWFWPNPSMSNLQDAKDGSQVDNSKQDNSDPKPGLVQARRPSGQGGYWFWRNPSANNLTDGKTSDSTVDLETMEKNARESDRQEGLKGPISNLQHKLRNTWRASFQRLSTNSLSKLDESTPSKNSTGSEDATKTNAVKEGWKEDFSKKENEKGMTKRDSFVVQEEDENGMVF